VDGAGPAHGANDAPPTVPWKTGERLPVFHSAYALLRISGDIASGMLSPAGV